MAIRIRTKSFPHLLFAAAACAIGNVAPAADAPSAPESRPLLEQLTRETQGVYAQVRRGVLRVQLPPPRWLDEAPHRDAALDRDNPLHKYTDLDPKVREQLARRRARVVAPEGEPVARGADPIPSTGPVTDADADRTSGALIVVPPPRPPDANAPSPTTAPAFAPNNVGLVLDDHGHLLVPLYLEPEAAAGQPIRVAADDGTVADARF